MFDQNFRLQNDHLFTIVSKIQLYPTHECFSVWVRFAKESSHTCPGCILLLKQARCVQITCFVCLRGSVQILLSLPPISMQAMPEEVFLSTAMTFFYFAHTYIVSMKFAIWKHIVATLKLSLFVTLFFVSVQHFITVLFSIAFWQLPFKPNFPFDLLFPLTKNIFCPQFHVSSM